MSIYLQNLDTAKQAITALGITPEAAQVIAEVSAALMPGSDYVDSAECPFQDILEDAADLEDIGLTLPEGLQAAARFYHTIGQNNRTMSAFGATTLGADLLYSTTDLLRAYLMMSIRQWLIGEHQDGKEWATELLTRTDLDGVALGQDWKLYGIKRDDTDGPDIYQQAVAALSAMFGEKVEV